MANHKSAEKRHRQSLKRRARNRSVKTFVRSAEKKAKVLIASKDLEGGKVAAKEAEKALARAAKKGVIPKGSARRHTSRIAKLVAKQKKK